MLHYTMLTTYAELYLKLHLRWAVKKFQLIQKNFAHYFHF